MTGSIRLIAVLLSTLAGCNGNGSAVDAGPGSDGAVLGDATAPPDADPCDLAACECEIDEDCDDHQVCRSGVGRFCECAAGYAGDPCTWGTVPADPGFQEPAVWETSGSATVSPQSSGNVDPGRAFFGIDAVCELATVEQRLSMPDHDRAEPLAAEVTYRATAVASEAVGAALGFRNTWHELAADTDWRTRRICLGAAAYGGSPLLRAGPATKAPGCPGESSTALSIDHIAIVPADAQECPAPGEVLAGDMESDFGWTFASSMDFAAEASFAADVGREGSRALRLATDETCASASATGRVSVPAGVSSPALSFWYSASTDAALELRIDGRPLFVARGTGAEASVQGCLPAWTRGGARSLAIELAASGAPCGESQALEALIDDVAVVEGTGCGASLVDPGFELAATGSLPVGVEPIDPERGSVRVVNEPTVAHEGSGALELELSVDCGQVRYRRWLVVPEPDGVEGPALRLWHRVPADPATTTGWQTSGSDGSFFEDGNWTEETICLDADHAGRPVELQLSIQASEDTCAVRDSPMRAWFDDFALITTPDCPVP